MGGSWWVAGRGWGIDLDKSDDIEFGYEKLVVWQRSIEWADRVLTFAENI